MSQAVTKYPVIPVNQALTDSLTLRLAMEDCTVIDKRLTSSTFTYYEDLNAIDDEPNPPKPIKIAYNGITVRVGLAMIPMHDSKTGETQERQFITLTVTSKLLKERYFEGISKATIKLVYEEFIAMDIFHCPYDAFLDGIISDTDICINRYADTETIFMDALRELQAQTGTKIKWTHLIDEKTTKGLVFQRKREFATPSLPFIKLYHKELELINKSAEFWNIYLFKTFGHAVKGLTRIEATIKNYKHRQRLEKYGIMPKYKTLREYLEIPQKDLWNFVVFSINSYIESKPRVRAPDLSPLEHIIFELIQNSVRAGMNFETIVETVVNGFTGSSPKQPKWPDHE